MNEAASPFGESVVAALRGAGMRATRARIAISETLAEAEVPLALSDLELRLAGEQLPRSTVYRAVGELTAAGILNRYEFEEGFARYEIADGGRGHHHHFVCRECRTVLDLEGLGELERHMGRAETALETARGLKIEGHRLDLFGLCPVCTEKVGQAGKPAPAREHVKKANQT